MPRQDDQVEEKLRALAESLKADAPDLSDAHMSGAIPDDLADEESRWLSLGGEEVEAFQDAVRAVDDDIRFEAISLTRGRPDPYRDAIWRFACLCVIRPDEDHIAGFFAENADEPEERTCFFGVEALTVRRRFEFADVRFLPTDHDEVPDADPWFRLESPVGAVIAVPVFGMNLKRMRRRAEVPARHALRVLRLAVRQNRFIPDPQLRFRLGDGFSFGAHLGGWETHPDARWELVLDEELEATVADQAVARLDACPETNLGRHAERALRWIEDASLSTDRVNAMLFYFFALEAMLGSRNQGLKGRDLAFKRTILSVATREHFTDPERAYRLYDEVRSDAVHGGEPELDEKEFQAFSVDVQEAINEYIELAEREEIVTRKSLIRFLFAHPERARLEEWLLERDPAWSEYFERL